MQKELISVVQVLESGKLLLCLQSGGKPEYSYIYREGAGVQWDTKEKGFISGDVNDWPYSKWLKHMVATALACGIECKFTNATRWVGFPESEKPQLHQE